MLLSHPRVSFLLSHELSFHLFLGGLYALQFSDLLFFLALLDDSLLFFSAAFFPHHPHHLFVQFDDRETICYLDSTSHGVLSLEVALLFFDHCLWNRSLKVSGDPWMHECDVSIVSVTGFPLKRGFDVHLDCRVNFPKSQASRGFLFCPRNGTKERDGFRAQSKRSLM